MLGTRVVSMQGDFLKVSFPDNIFNAVYTKEATCYAPDLVCIFLLCLILTCRFFKVVLVNIYLFFVKLDKEI